MSCSLFSISIPGASRNLRMPGLQKEHWLLDEAHQRLQKLSPAGTIDHTVIAGKTERHHGLHTRLATNRHHPLRDAPHSEDGCLRWIEDGQKDVDTVHAQIADRERAVGQVFHCKLGCLGAMDQVLAAYGDLAQGKLIRPMDHGNYQPLFDGRCHSEVDFWEWHDRATAPGGIDPWVASE